MKTQLPRIILGVAIVAAGAMLLLDRLGVPGLANTLGTWWPMFVVAAGIASLISSPRNFLWPTAIIAFGVLLQFDRLDMIDFNPWQMIWPAILIVVGLSILLGRSGKNIQKATKDELQNITTVLSGGEYKNNSTDFKGAKIVAIMGGSELDIRDSTIKTEATIEVTAICGGIELRVPKGVMVKNHTNCILGAAEIKTPTPASNKSPVLNIVGDVIMSGLEIKD